MKINDLDFWALRKNKLGSFNLYGYPIPSTVMDNDKERHSEK